MGVHSELKKTFTPVAVKHGLTSFAKDSFGVSFIADQTRKLTIETYPRGYLRLIYYDRKIGEFFPSDFVTSDEDMGPNDYYGYHDDGEFKQIARFLLGAFDELMMPYVKYIRPLVARTNEDMYRALSVHTVERAENFMRLHDLTLEHTTDNFRFIEDYLVNVRGENRLLQKNRYNEKNNLVLDAAAYLGELKRRRHEPARWTWVESNEYLSEDGSAHKRDYTYEVESEGSNYDPLGSAIQQLWNYYPEIKRYSLEWYWKDGERCMDDWCE